MSAEKRSTLNKELLFLILQFCKDEGYKRTAHMLERETGCYFDMEFFEDMVLNGKWEDVDKYLSAFTNPSDNEYSTKIYFEIRKLNFLEALDNDDRVRALDILMKELKVFALGNEQLFREMTQLLTLDDFREHESLSMYVDAESCRKILMDELKKLIEANPVFHEKLKFPSISSQRLRRFINQGLNWQHIQCKYPHPNPDIKTLFEDHICQLQQDGLLMQPTENPLVTSTVPGQNCRLVFGTAISSSNIGGCHTNSQKCLLGTKEDGPGQNCSLASRTSDNLPKTVVRILNELSSPMSIDFHPVQHTILLVGTDIGDIGLWDVISGAKILSRSFKVWNIGLCSAAFKTAMMKDPCMSVNRVAWSPYGCFFGIAYSKHIVQLYSYHGQQKLEIDAHVGGVNDLAFSTTPTKQLVLITGGDDKTVKVWDVTSGVQLQILEGHEAPIYSLYPYSKKDIHFVFSTSVDGKIIAWLCNSLEANINFDAPGLEYKNCIHLDAPGLACTTIAYDADSRRLFSCGTNKNGESFLVEWNESEGGIKRSYLGLCKNSSAIVQFCPTMDKFLAAADDHVIKIWDMDNVELLTIIDADGGLPANPHFRFNKEDSLMAVIGDQNKIKILAADCDLQLLKLAVTDFTDPLSDISHALSKFVINPSPVVVSSGEDYGQAPTVPTNSEEENIKDVNDTFNEKPNSKADIYKTIHINRPKCQSLQLNSQGKADKILKLLYTNAGNAILALASNATILLWKWPQNNLNFDGKATTNVQPQVWQPKSCSRLMTNDLIGRKLEKAVPCLALSKNDSYGLSASGGRISLFNLLTFKTMLSFMPPSPAATSLAFYPRDNNIVAIGMDDSIILIYNVRVDEIISRLQGHSGIVTGLAFSNKMNVLVSSATDAQIIIWNVDGWEKHKSKYLQLPEERMPVVKSNTQVQFHLDQVHFLVINAEQLSVHEAKELACVQQWAPKDSTRILQATFSCDSRMVYACFTDGNVSIFDASHLELKYQIILTAYLPSTKSLNVYPLSISANPQKATQFAVGLADDGIMVFEPQKPENEWYTCENESTSASSCLEEC